MKFSSQIAFLAGAACATNVSPRDTAALNGVLSNITSSVQNVDSAVKNFTTDSQPVMKATDDLLQTIKKGKATVDASSNITVTDAIGLRQPLMTLQTQGEQLATDLKAKRPAVEKAKLCNSTYEQISSINSASEDLVKSAVSKVPEAYQSLASGFSKGFTSSVQDVMEYYAPGNCTNGNDQSASGSSTTASPSASQSGDAKSAVANVTPAFSLLASVVAMSLWFM